MEKENMKIVITGHVDHGKSTLIGRLLYDTDSIPRAIVEDVKKICQELGKDMEYSYLLDSFKEEREQNITIDTTQIFFNTKNRDYVIIDAPGHVEFIKNMMTGASQAEAAVLIVDVEEGIKEQTKRHAYILGMLGIKQVIVVINKMDKIKNDLQRFDKVKNEISDFLNNLEIDPKYIIPISANKGINILKISDEIQWYDGPSLVEALDSLQKKIENNNSLILPVQDVYNIDDKDIIVGRIASGNLALGQEILLLPSNNKTKVKTLEEWNKSNNEAQAGQSIGLTIEASLDVNRGEIICNNRIPRVTDTFKANIFWMGDDPIKVNDKILLRCSTQETDCTIEKIESKINSSTLEKLEENSSELHGTEVGKVMVKTNNPLVIENFNDFEELGRFVLVKNDNILGAGIITK